MLSSRPTGDVAGSIDINTYARVVLIRLSSLDMCELFRRQLHAEDICTIS